MPPILEGLPGLLGKGSITGIKSFFTKLGLAFSFLPENVEFHDLAVACVQMKKCDAYDP